MSDEFANIELKSGTEAEYLASTETLKTNEIALKVVDGKNKIVVGNGGGIETATEYLNSEDMERLITAETDGMKEIIAAETDGMKEIIAAETDGMKEIITAETDAIKEIITTETINAVDGQEIDLTHPKTAVIIDCVTENKNISFGDLGSNGFEVSVYSAGNYICNISGSGLVDAVAKSNQIFRAEVLSDNLIEIKTSGDGSSTGGDSYKLGDTVTSLLSYNRAPEGLLQDTFDKCSIGRYPEWYSVCKDKFEQQHIDAGQEPSGDGYFFPTPVPGSFGRNGLPNLDLTDTNIDFNGNKIINLPDWITVDRRDGTAFNLKLVSGTLPTGLTEQMYFLGFGLNEVSLYLTEDDATTNTNVVSFTDSGSGEFKLTQEGIGQEDIMIKHRHTTGVSVNGNTDRKSAYGYHGQSGNIGTGRVPGATEGPTSPRYLAYASYEGEGNESRPAFKIEFNYIKVEYVTPFTGTPASGVKVDTGWVDTGPAGTFKEVVHGLDSSFGDLVISIQVRDSSILGSETTPIFYYSSGSARFYGCGLRPKYNALGVEDFNSIYFQHGGYSVRGLSDIGKNSAVDQFKLVIIKHNYSSPILDQPRYTGGTYPLGDGDKISLVKQNNILEVDSTLGDLAIEIENSVYNTQKVIVNNIGIANKCTIINSIGGWTNNATVLHGESASCEVANNKLTKGNFNFDNGAIRFNNGSNVVMDSISWEAVTLESEVYNKLVEKTGFVVSSDTMSVGVMGLWGIQGVTVIVAYLTYFEIRNVNGTNVKTINDNTTLMSEDGYLVIPRLKI